MARRIYHVHDSEGRKIRVPSVTTVLRDIGSPQGLMHWAYSQGLEAARREYEEGVPAPESLSQAPRTAATIGTITHAMIEADVQGLAFNRDLHPKELLPAADCAFGAWERWQAKREIQLVATETSLVSSAIRYGGTLDLVLIVDGVRTLIDIKTGRAYPNHLRQIAAYSGLWLENRPDQPLDEIGLLYLSTDDEGYSWKHYDANGPDALDAYQAFFHALELYNQERRQRERER